MEKNKLFIIGIVLFCNGILMMCAEQVASGSGLFGWIGMVFAVAGLTIMIEDYRNGRKRKTTTEEEINWNK